MLMATTGRLGRAFSMAGFYAWMGRIITLASAALEGMCYIMGEGSAYDKETGLTSHGSQTRPNRGFCEPLP